MAAGRIKSLKDKHFGFITVDGRNTAKRDVFFHGSDLEGVQFSELVEGDKVTFDIRDTEKGERAFSVRRQ